MSGAWAGVTIRLVLDGSFDWRIFMCYVPFPYGLSFLTAWFPQVSQTSYMVARSFKSKFSRKQGGSYVTFYGLALEET